MLRMGGLVYSEVSFLQHVHAGAWDFTRFTALGPLAARGLVRRDSAQRGWASVESGVGGLKVSCCLCLGEIGHFGFSLN